MLFHREIHDVIGGYRHHLRTYEDWDYKIRLVAHDCDWVHSGIVGVAIRRHNQGLSAAPPWLHMLDRLRVMRLNWQLLRAHIDTPFILRILAKVVLTGVKWSALTWYWEMRRRLSSRAIRGRNAS